MVANKLGKGPALDNENHPREATVAAWAKRCYFAGRGLMDRALRPHDLGSTQWYVLWHLARGGPVLQRDLGQALELERPTLSGVVATLVRKGLVRQAAPSTDQRQRCLELTTEGRALWHRLPDLQFIHEAAFGGMDTDDLEAAIRVLRAATERLQALAGEGAREGEEA